MTIRQANIPQVLMKWKALQAKAVAAGLVLTVASSEMELKARGVTYKISDDLEEIDVAIDSFTFAVSFLTP